MNEDFRVSTVETPGIFSGQYPDVYFSAGYGHASEAVEDGGWHLAEVGHRKIIYPFMLRKIEGSNSFDMASPYGYAGAWGEEEATDKEWADFRVDLKSWALQNSVVSEFIRIGSIVPGVESIVRNWTDVKVRRHNTTFAIDTSLGYEKCWSNFDSRVRTKVRKATKCGLNCSVERGSLDWAIRDSPARALYRKTMERIGAKEYYKFSDDYFSRLVEYCNTAQLIVKDAEGSVVAAAMMFLSKNDAHLHLVGTEENALRYGVGPYVYDQTARWVSAEGYKLLHIGGGVQDEDSLHYFKAGFGGTPKDFYVGQSIIDEERYSQLVSARTNKLPMPPEQDDFFPLYRA